MSLRRTPGTKRVSLVVPAAEVTCECRPLREMVKWSRSPAMVVDDSADYCRWVCSEVAGMVPMELMASMQWTVLFDSSCDIEAISGMWQVASCLSPDDGPTMGNLFHMDGGALVPRFHRDRTVCDRVWEALQARRPVEKDVLEACAQHMMRRNEGCLDHPYVTAVCVPSVEDAERALEVFKGFSVTFLDENLGPGKKRGSEMPYTGATVRCTGDVEVLSAVSKYDAEDIKWDAQGAVRAAWWQRG